ncbi:RT1 class I histocompatibility antigen, AA alpha chain-like [Sceloporus undulatus]|uniref:RT1 class I histocompatibility antigen, AA alpha chain-like n=1 Tax=Sceloporus undulatus TaxID=8520 RepID=UPI001C4DA34C|nr:RT1 class I histocompatibility antigen, AA alpha chain-like [Sceloporus undulatus]
MERLLLLVLFSLSAFVGPPGLALPRGSQGPPARDGSSSHSLRYFYTAVSEAGTGMPHFLAVGYVDGQPITLYDSNGQRFLPQAPWMEDATSDISHYWETRTAVLKSDEAAFRADLATLRDRYNQSGDMSYFLLWHLFFLAEW